MLTETALWSSLLDTVVRGMAKELRREGPIHQVIQCHLIQAAPNTITGPTVVWVPQLWEHCSLPPPCQGIAHEAWAPSVPVGLTPCTI